MSFKDSAELAVDNISKWGDTDIFPYPLEITVFGDRRDDVVQFLSDIDDNFDAAIEDHRFWFERGLTLVGYNGLRVGTTIEPIWNAYLLSQCVELGSQIESERKYLPDSIVHSYRLLDQSEDGKLFHEGGYSRFLDRAVVLGKESDFVLVTDIADFYPRVYHHKIENALSRVDTGGTITQKIMRTLTILSGNASYGLPVGGNAARILSELVLHSTDRLLHSGGNVYTRYSDDYRIFVQSEDAGYSAMVQLSEYLANEGLALQKSKTQVLRASELLERINADPDKTSEQESDEPESKKENARRTFFGLSLRYDPYSSSAEEDYKELKEALGSIDLVGMLADEVRKSRISIPFTRRMIRALRLLDQPQQSAAVEMLLVNFSILAPVLPTVLITLKDLMPDLPIKDQENVCEAIRERIHSASYAFRLSVNLAFAVRVLAELSSSENEAALVALYSSTSTSFVRRDIILTMARWGFTHWISMRKTEFSSMQPPERRAFITASYNLGDEGSYWRKSNKKGFSRSELMVRDWVAARVDGDSKWEIPI